MNIYNKKKKYYKKTLVLSLIIVLHIGHSFTLLLHSPQQHKCLNTKIRKFRENSEKIPENLLTCKVITKLTWNYVNK